MISLLLLTNIDSWSRVIHLGLQPMVVIMGTLLVEEAKKSEIF